MAEPAPWSLRPRPVPWRQRLAVGAGALIAAVYIGTGDIGVATTMGAKFGFQLWWTYAVLGLAGWTLVDMSVRYYLRFGRTPMSLFKDLHPALTAYLFVTVVVCGILGAYSQWNACALVVSGLFPGVPLEAGGTAAAAVALLFIYQGVYHRIERWCAFGLLALVAAFAASALAIATPWSEALFGLVPRVPDDAAWKALFASNAGSVINAWLILIYPYTMMEKGWYARDLQGKVDLLSRVRWDYGVGIAAAGVVALPIMATAYGIAGPYGFVPRSYMDLSVLLEPVAGRLSMWLFLGGLFLAAWTSGVGWMLCATYALLDIGGLPVRIDARPVRPLLFLLFLPSALLLFLRVNPVYQILIFAAFLTFVFPLVGLAVLYRITRPDMGYFGWTLRRPVGIAIVALDLFAVAVSLYVGGTMLVDQYGQFQSLFGG